MKTDLTPFKKASILQYTDSKAAEHIFTYGSRNLDIQKMVFNIVSKYKKFYIQLAAVWCLRNEEEMQLADAGSRGPWFPAQEFSMEQKIIDKVKANFNFTINLMATYKNRLTEKYFSAARKWKVLGRTSLCKK